MHLIRFNLKLGIPAFPLPDKPIGNAPVLNVTNSTESKLKIPEDEISG